ncbi:MAG: ABC transporter permease [Flavipsychrobacter sp.]|nr:ABC transporter permease [Flavipsychrobacter sp.]
MDVSPAIQEDQKGWTEVIAPTSSPFDLHLADVWRYRDLLMLLVRRDFIATYKQTILGPTWFFLQPILTAITYWVIFGQIANLSTENLPALLFYLPGITLWNYFSECLNKTASVLKDNAAIFGKVYFPRLIMPLSIVVSNLVKLGIQMFLFLVIWAFYLFAGFKGGAIHPNLTICLIPFLIIVIGGLGLGFGMVISSLTTKYRDLIFLLSFGVQLLMYATPVIQPLSAVKGKWRLLFLANPMTSIIETFRYAFLGTGSFSINGLLYSTIFMIVVLFLGILIFNKVEKSFMDTV